MQNDNENNFSYIDYFELSKEKQKELYNEFISAYAEEKRISLMLRLIPLFFAVAVLLLVVASVIVLLTDGFELPFIVFVCTIVAVMAIFVIVKFRLDKTRHAQAARYAEWLRDVKHVIAELKD